MKQLLILNGVATYKQAPVPIKILSSSLSTIFDKMQSHKAVRNIVLIDQDEHRFAEQIEETAKAYSDLSLEIIKVDPIYRMLYNNESAVMNLLQGANPLPKSKESNAIVYGVEAFLESDKKVVFISGKTQNQGMFEVNKNTTPRSILEVCSVEKEFKAMYFGYPMGRFIGENDLDTTMEMTTDYIQIFNEDSCILDELKHIAEAFLQVSCGRCVFGYEGITQINMIVEEIVHKKGKPEDLKKLDKLAKQMKDQTICDVGSVISTVITDVLNNFYEEIEGHITQKVCKAMVCEKFMSYHILASKCIGCMECVDVCEDEAILGKEKFVHVIDQKECSGCGACINICPEEAIVKAGAVKPKCPPKPIPCLKK